MTFVAEPNHNNVTYIIDDPTFLLTDTEKLEIVKSLFLKYLQSIDNETNIYIENEKNY